MVDSSWVAFKQSWPWPWRWFGSHSIPSCISHRPPSTYQMSLKSEEVFCGRTNHRDSSSSRSRDTKSRTNIKNPAPSIYILCSSLRIGGNLPALIVNGGGDRPWKVQFLELQRPHDLDLGSGHTAYRRASVTNFYLHTKFHWNRKNFFVDALTTGTQVQGQVTQKHKN